MVLFCIANDGVEESSVNTGWDDACAVSTRNTEESFTHCGLQLWCGVPPVPPFGLFYLMLKYSNDNKKETSEVEKTMKEMGTVTVYGMPQGPNKAVKFDLLQ